LLLIHEKLVPLTGPLKFITPVVAPLQKLWLDGSITEGVGNTVTEKLCAVPVQPFADGVTVITAVSVAVVLLVAVNAPIFPVPVEASPMLEILFVHL
jgi:hypothetical protein